MAGGIGGRIALEGAQQVINELKKLGSELKVLKQEASLLSAQFKNTGDSFESFDKKAKNLQATQQKLREIQEKLALQIEKWRDEQKKANETIEQHKQKLEAAKQKLVEIEKQYGKNSQEYKSQAQLVDDLDRELGELNQQYEKNETKINKQVQQLVKAETEYNTTENALQDLGREAEKAGISAKDLGINLQDSGEKSENAADGGFTVLKGVLANLATEVIQKTINGLKELTRTVVQAGIDFDSGMSRVKAISGATSSEMEQLTAKAIEMGRTTKFSAAEASQALYYMAMAGWRTADMLEGLEPIMNLAAASGEGLARTSDIVTDALTAMGYGAEDAGHLADVMAAAAANANTTVDMMGSTFKYVGAVVGSLGYTMEDTAISISLMANAGIKAEMAGTALRSLMMRLSTDTGGAAKAAKELGVEITNADGSMRKWDDVVIELRSAFQGLTQAEQSQYAKTIAGTRAMNGFLAIMNATESDVKQVTTAINNSSGAAKEMAETMLDNVGGQFTKLQRQIQTEFLKVWEKIAPTVQKAIQSIAKEMKKIDWNAIAGMAENAINIVMGGFQWLMDNSQAVIATIGAIIAAFAVIKIVEFGKKVKTTIKDISDSVKNLYTLVTNHPLMILVAAFSAINAAIFACKNYLDSLDFTTVNLNGSLGELRDTVKESVSAWDELSDAQAEIVEKTNKEMDGYQSLVNELNNIVDENGKVQKGYEQRAEFIANTLADAFGIEIRMQNGVIQGYGKLMDNIDELIKKKRAEAIMEGQEGKYKEAIQNRTKAVEDMTAAYDAWQQKEAEMKDLEAELHDTIENGSVIEKVAAQQRIDAKRREVTEVQKIYNNAQGIVFDYTQAITLYENNMAEMSAKNYDKIKESLDGVVAKREQTKELEGEIYDQSLVDEQNYLAELVRMNDAAGNDLYAKQIAQTERTIAQKQKENAKYSKEAQKGLDEVNVIWRNGLDQTMSTITGASWKFEKGADGNIQAYINGVKSGEPKSEAEMAKLIDGVIKEILNKKGASTQAGVNLINGVNSGIVNQSAQSSVFRSIAYFGNTLLTRLKNSLQEHSPSRATRQMGIYLLQGLGIGMKTEENEVLEQTKTFGQSIIDTLNGALEEGVSTNALQALQTAIPGEFSAKMGVDTTRMAEAAQNADKSLVEQFKEALSQMTVEMDDQEMGRFVDNTVTKLVYNS